MKEVIQLKHVKKKYGTTIAVNGVTLEVFKGEIFGIVGPNGAGKTTLIEMIEGLRIADSGEVIVLGNNVRTHAQENKEHIGVLLQSTSIPERATVNEIFTLFSSFYKKTLNRHEVSQLLGLEDKLNAKYSSLSGGWKQRVSLALALINDPHIVFLDEPSMGLDPKARSEMWDMIMRLRDDGRTIVVTTHYMEEAETLCDRVALIAQGELVALDTPEQLIKQLGGNKRISFKNAIHASKDSITTLPYVTNMEWESVWVRLYSSNPDQTLKHLFRLAEDEAWVVNDLKVEDGSMNDVFNQLTLNGVGVSV